MKKITLQVERCYHCGQELPPKPYRLDDKQFCCAGCQGVYSVLAENDLCSYYRYNDAPGQTVSGADKQTAYLDEPKVISQLADYTDQHTTVVTFYIPAVHCSSCIWLLEHLHKAHKGVIHSRIDFLKKQVCITFHQQDISLRKLVELITSLGYEPLITAKDESREVKTRSVSSLVRRIAVAGFCMGNVMLFSFPEYFGLPGSEIHFRQLFGWLNLALTIPVTFYCAREFFISAIGGLKKRFVNLDAPLALIIAVLFMRTAYEIFTHTGAGFSDTLTGLVFLLLMGRWVKQRAYQHFSFQRDYRSYFPMAVTVLENDREKTVMTEDLAAGDRILVRNNEIIPADSVLLKGQAYIDFSFVTGESSLVYKSAGDPVYAGGRQQGEALELEVVKRVSQSYLTSLWNNEIFSSGESRIQTFNDSIAQYFGAAALGIAAGSAVFWLFQHDGSRAWQAFTAVLIVACPCVLSLSSPFILSAILTVFDKHKFYLRNTEVVESLAKTDTVVFDKTGTLTAPNRFDPDFKGYLSAEEKVMVASLARNSNHPLSRELVKWFGTMEYLDTDYFMEVPGMGVSGMVKGNHIVIGNAAMVSAGSCREKTPTVYVKIEGVIMGHFAIRMKYRNFLAALISRLKETCMLHLLSGDSHLESNRLKEWFAPANIRIGQSPRQKLDYVKNLQDQGHTVMMVGDGLNDAGALRQGNTGIAVSDHINNFSPACDAIINGDSIHLLPQFMALAKDAVRTVKWSFVIAASYNIAGLCFAVQGTLAPLTAAVLMPLSTVTILTFSYLATRRLTRKHQLQ
ncbi:heavy metal translocating P-type ATPase [Hufsiella ginkgonis]|uniref:HAD-IC family P-type ATPase n=1 Tax=Hufsiella ginkgonis TaxID=2695274 RepID=A0A7K1Y158_9SPHI|nr:heavy metal translocating P-type ATPase metal-binding domain-containing protein [Hufsiella ginkgonis]MXV16749.1 HAD-IC family P-type ATPase [Hufsiella ginkgonis]